MTDIAPLIERLHKWPWPDCPLPSEAVADMQEAAAALRSQALEIDRRISVELLNVERETCDRIRSDNDGLRQRIRQLEADNEKMLAMLGGDMGMKRIRELEHEVERLTRHCQIANADREHDADEIEKLEQRIRELEGVVVGLDERSTIYERRAHELEAERDAIRAKTIEELRAPTEEMVCAGDKKIIEALQDHTFALRDPTPAKACWQAMLEVAIRALAKAKEKE